MLPSLHRRLIYIGDETIPSFERAWAAVPERAAGRRIPHGCADPRWLRYDQAGRFATHLERLFAMVGRERCQVLLFDDLVADPAAVCRQLMDFAGLEPQPPVEVAVRRPGKSVRFRWLQRALKRPPVAVREFLAGEQFRSRVCDLDGNNRRKVPEAVLSIRKRLLAWNRVTAPIEPLPAGLRERIAVELEDEVLRLGELLGRDLSHWLQPQSDSIGDTVIGKNNIKVADRRCAAFSH